MGVEGPSNFHVNRWFGYGNITARSVLWWVPCYKSLQYIMIKLLKSCCIDSLGLQYLRFAWFGILWYGNYVKTSITWFILPRQSGHVLGLRLSRGCTQSPHTHKCLHGNRIIFFTFMWHTIHCLFVFSSSMVCFNFLIYLVSALKSEQS